MSRTIAVCNQKGGVGKTTTAINLGAALAGLGAKVLLVDLDPQANATGGLGLDKKNLPGSIYETLLNGVSLEQVTLPTKIPNLQIVPSHISLSGAELELVPSEGRNERLKQALGSSRGAHDFVLIDCPPSLGLLTVNAMTAADSILIPLQCEYYALEGLSQLLTTIRMVKESLNPSLAIEGIVLTMADFRTKLTSDVIADVRRFFGSQVYEVVVPRSIRLGEAPSHGMPISEYDPTSSGAKAYQLLAQKIKEVNDARNQRFRQGDSGPDTGRDPAAERGACEGAAQGDPGEPVSAPKEPR